MRHFIILIFPFILFYSCEKEKVSTSIKLRGIITNDATGIPLKNVSVWIVMYDYSGRLYSDSSTTNNLGEYSLDVTGYDINILSVNINKPGFVFYTFEPERNSDIIKNIIMYPFDSYIKFKIINKLGIDYAIYGTWWTFIYPPQFLSAVHDPIFVDPGKIYTEIRNCPGNQYAYVTWDYDSYSSELQFPHLDSIYVNRGDTAIYTIQF